VAMVGPTNPAEAHFDKGMWGWDGSVWRKIPLLLGYTDRWVEAVVNASADAGINILYTAAVPAGYVYVLNAAYCYNETSTSGQDIGPYGNSISVLVVQAAAVPANSVTVTGLCNIVLKAGDKVRIRFTACTAGDSLVGRVWGVKVKVS